MMITRGVFPIILTALVGVCSWNSSAEDFASEFHVAGWVQVGRIEHSSDTANDPQNNFNKDWTENAGSVLSVKTRIDENWDGSFGMGAVQVHLSRGSINNANIWYP